MKLYYEHFDCLFITEGMARIRMQQPENMLWIEVNAPVPKTAPRGWHILIDKRGEVAGVAPINAAGSFIQLPNNVSTSSLRSIRVREVIEE